MSKKPLALRLECLNYLRNIIKNENIIHHAFSQHSVILQAEFEYLTDAIHLTIYSQAVSGPFINLKHSLNLDNQSLNRNSEMAHMKDIVIEFSILFITIL